MKVQEILGSPLKAQLLFLKALETCVPPPRKAPYDSGIAAPYGLVAPSVLDAFPADRTPPPKSCFFLVRCMLNHQRLTIRLLQFLQVLTRLVFYHPILSLFYQLVFQVFHSFLFSSRFVFSSLRYWVMRSVRPLVWDSASIFWIAALAMSSSSGIFPVTSMTPFR